MIKQLDIINFQSWKKGIFQFHSGINAIVGESDVGKSAVKRAIEWVVNNKPSGEAFRSNWGGDTEVKIRADKCTIGRGKGKDNTYFIWHDNQLSPMFFKSFNQDVPEEIKKLLNISSLSLQSQFSSPFLLSVSSGEVAKYLNKIVHLDKIDLAMSNINKILRKEKQDLKYAEETLEEQRESIKQYSWLSKAEECLDKLEIVERKLIADSIIKSDLFVVIKRVEVCEKQLREYSELEKAEGELEEALELEKKIAYQVTMFTDLERLFYTIEEVEEEVIGFANVTKKWEMEFKKLMPEVCPLCGRGD
jgi:chromosome segregation ATPase